MQNYVPLGKGFWEFEAICTCTTYYDMKKKKKKETVW